MKILFITGATVGEPYDSCLRRLRGSLKEFNLRHLTFHIPDRGSWVRNAQAKGEIIYKSLIQSYECFDGIVWLDADCMIKQPPVLFDSLKCDFACHYKDGKELLSGTLFFASTQRSLKLAYTWVEAMKKEGREWDQRILQRIVERMVKVDNLVVEELPASYVQIFDLMAHHGKPVIEHYQASRKVFKGSEI